MRLYLIKRRPDGLFFGNINGHWMLHNPKGAGDGQYWSSKPQMLLKTPDGIVGNLRKLCSKPYWDTKVPAGVSPAVGRGWKVLAWKDFDERKLKAYEVVIMDVDVLTTTATPAAEFVQIEAFAVTQG